MELKLSLRLEQRHSHANSFPILGLSPLELELLLDKSLEEVRIFHEDNPDWGIKTPSEKKGNYFYQKNFLDDCRSVAGKISRERQLENPQVLVERGEEREYCTAYNPQI